MRLALAGDLMIGGRLFAAELDAGRRPHPEASLVDVFARADHAWANLEMSVTERPLVGAGPFDFRLAPRHAGALGAFGLTLFGLANNHSLDAGPAGLQDTRSSLEAHALAHVGAGADLEDKGVAMLARLVAPEPHPGLDVAHPDRPETIEALVARVRDHRAAGRAVVVSLHFLGDFCSTWRPPDDAAAVALACARAGATLIHGHGAHHVLPVERLEQTWVLWCLGGLLDDYGVDVDKLRIYQRLDPLVIPPWLPLPAGPRAPELLRHPVYRNDLGAVAEAEFEGPRLRALRVRPIRMEPDSVGLVEGEEAAWVRERMGIEDPGGWLVGL